HLHTFKIPTPKQNALKLRYFLCFILFVQTVRECRRRRLGTAVKSGALFACGKCFSGGGGRRGWRRRTFRRDTWRCAWGPAGGGSSSAPHTLIIRSSRRFSRKRKRNMVSATTVLSLFLVTSLCSKSFLGSWTDPYPDCTRSRI
ncbi:hypothetical protein V8G54_022454, partial [Vigna mungo]